MSDNGCGNSEGCIKTLGLLYKRAIGICTADLKCLFSKSTDVGSVIFCLKHKGWVRTELNGKIYPDVTLTREGRLTARTLSEDQGGESRLCGDC